MDRKGRSRRRMFRSAGVAVALFSFFTGCGKTDKPTKISTVGLRAYFATKPGAPVSDPSSSAYLQSHLQVEGEVFKDGAPVARGAVAIKAESTEIEFDQSIFVPLQAGGKFRAPPGAFDSIPPGAQVSVTAQLNPGGEDDSKTIILNSESDRWRIAIDWLLPVIILFGYCMFMYSFTGRENPKKNRVAIIFSYVIIVVFLGVPILAPVTLLRMFPKSVYAMIGYPAGLVVTRIGDPPRDSAQWAINIGGYSRLCRARCLEPSDPRFPFENKSANSALTAASRAASASTPKAAAAPVTSGSPSGSTGGTSLASSPVIPGAASAATGSPVGGAQTTPVSSGATPVVTVVASDPSTPPTIGTRDDSPLSSDDTTDELVHPDLLNPPIVKVEGGLVVPLYVIALSIIGGAINMTRKVPGFQREGEDGEPLYRAERENSSLFSMKAEEARADETGQQPEQASPPDASAVPLPEQAKKIDAELDPLIVSQMKRVDDSASAVPRIRTLVQQMRDLYAENTEPTLNEFATYDEWYVSRPRLREILGGSWRVELLNQYMYLISAPFLAIVTYYILDLLGLSKAGVVVVLSFSVGLISEKIVTWILGIATGYMQSPNSSPAANKAS